MATKKTAAPVLQPVIVTTAHRGVFFGYTADPYGDVISLERARNVLYWSPDCRGFMGLAANGPTANCKLGAVCEIALRNITSVSMVTEHAEKAWLAVK